MCDTSSAPQQSPPQALPYAGSWSGGPIPASRACPICSRPLTGKKPVRLYGFAVCKKCRNGFANRRQGAFLIDIILLRMIEGGLVALFLLLAASPNAGTGSTAFEALTSLVSIAFLFVLPLRDAVNGISPGKWLCGVQVVDRVTREPIGVGQSYMRNLVTLVPCVGFIVPAIQLIAGPRWGDSWANTVVIWRKHAHKLPFDPRGTYCLSCGYDLTGNVSGICPECGTPVPAVRPLTPSVGLDCSGTNVNS